MSLRLLERSEPETTDVDPRIQARRDEVSRDHHRRRRRRLVAVVVVVAVIAVLFTLTRSPALDVDQVDVVATPHVSAQQVMETGGLRVGQHLVDVDPGAVRSRLRTLPWVADARVDLDWWSGAVQVVVTERVPVAAVATSNAEWVIADAEGRAIATLPPGGPGLIAVENVAPVEPGTEFGPAILAPLEVIGGLSEGLRSRVFAVVAGTDGSLQMKVLPSGVVDLCQPDRLAEKLASATTWFAAVDDTNLATLSVCVPDSVVATRGPARP